MSPRSGRARQSYPKGLTLLAPASTAPLGGAHTLLCPRIALAVLELLGWYALPQCLAHASERAHAHTSCAMQLGYRDMGAAMLARSHAPRAYFARLSAAFANSQRAISVVLSTINVCN